MKHLSDKVEVISTNKRKVEYIDCDSCHHKIYANESYIELDDRYTIELCKKCAINYIADVIKNESSDNMYFEFNKLNENTYEIDHGKNYL